MRASLREAVGTSKPRCSQYLGSISNGSLAMERGSFVTTLTRWPDGLQPRTALVPGMPMSIRKLRDPLRRNGVTSLLELEVGGSNPLHPSGC